jgi:hypothetical protein
MKIRLIILFIVGSCKNAFSSSLLSNDRIISEIMSWKGCGKKWSWPNLRYYPRIFMKELRKITKDFIDDAGLRVRILT